MNITFSRHAIGACDVRMAITNKLSSHTVVTPYPTQAFCNDRQTPRQVVLNISAAYGMSFRFVKLLLKKLPRYQKANVLGFLGNKCMITQP